MLRTLMKSKLHRATVTASDVNYVGSITIDRSLVEAAQLVPHERVQVLSVTTGARLETYVMVGGRDTGEICLNGAAARLMHVGDIVIIISYGLYDDAETGTHVPVVVLCDERNQPRVLRGHELPVDASQPAN